MYTMYTMYTMYLTYNLYNMYTMYMKTYTASDFRMNIRSILNEVDGGEEVYIKRYATLYKVHKIESNEPDWDNARPLTANEKVEVDAAIDGLKTGKTTLEFTPGAVVDGPGFLNAPNYADVKAKIEAVAKAQRKERDPFGINEPTYEPMDDIT